MLVYFPDCTDSYLYNDFKATINITNKLRMQALVKTNPSNGNKLAKYMYKQKTRKEEPMIFGFMKKICMKKICMLSLVDLLDQVYCSIYNEKVILCKLHMFNFTPESLSM